MVLTSVADDGVQVIIPGWTNQSSTPYSSGLESSGGPNSALYNQAQYNGYAAETVPIGSVSSALSATPTTEVWVARFYAPANYSANNVDYWITNLNSGTVTSVLAGIFSLSGAQLSKDITTYSASAVTGTPVATGLQTFANWSTPITLIGGTFYYFVLIEAWTSFAPSVAAAPANPVINQNLATNTYDFATYSTSATMPSSITIASLTASVLAKPWAGLRT